MKYKTLRWYISVLFSGLIVLMVVSGGCSGGTTESPTAITQINRDVSPVEAHDLIIENQDNEQFVILDVRTPEEFADGHIENAINIDVNSGQFREDISKLNKNDTYLVYCRSGRRSDNARDIMEELGFSDVYNMTGGIIDWENEGYPVVK